MGSNVVKKTQKIIAVCSLKNSGKTTLLTKLLKAFSAKKVKTAVIKHDGHDFSCDIPETDSFRYKDAGAYGTAVFSKYRTFIHKEITDESIEKLIRQFPEADIIFLEGMKDSEYLKIEAIRKEISEKPVSNPQGRFLIATNWELDKFQEPTVNIDDIDAILKKIMEEDSKADCFAKNM